MNPVVSITGHRPDKIGGYDPCDLHTAIKEALKVSFDVLKPSKVITGMAQGVDQFAAQVALNMGIPYLAAIPFAGQESIWPARAKENYHRLLDSAAEKVYVNAEGFAKWKLLKRNEWMVDNSDVLVAVWDGSKGGTSHCVEYARSKAKIVVVINPNEL